MLPSAKAGLEVVCPSESTS